MANVGLMGRSIVRARPAAVDLGRSAAMAAVAAVSALLLGYILAVRGPAAAILLMALPALAIVLLAHPYWIFAGSVGVALLVPYTYSVGTAQAAAFRVAAAGALATTVVLLVRQRANLRVTFVDAAVATFLIMTVASWLATGGGDAAVAINPIVPVAFYVGARALTVAAIWRTLWVVTVTGALATTTVLYELFVTRTPLFVPRAEYLWNTTSETIFRPGGVFGSPPGAAAVLSITALCGLALIVHHRGSARLVAIGCVAINVAGVIATFTRAGYLGLALGLVIFILLAGSRLVTPRRFVLGAATAAALFAVAFLPTLEATTWFQQGLLRQGNLQIRESYWSLARPLVTDSTQHVLVGHGVNSLVAGNPDLNASIGPGLNVMLVWFVGAPARAVVRIHALPRELRPAVGALVAAIASFLAISFAGDSMRHPPTLAAVALATGMLVTLSCFGQARR